VPFDCRALVIGHDLLRQPSLAQSPEQVGMRAGRDQVSVQDRVHLILDPRAVPDDLIAACHQSAQALGVRIRQPDFGQEIGGPQRCQYAGIDLVGLDVRMRNCLDLQRIGHDHASHIRRKRTDNGHCVAGRFNDDLVLFAQASGSYSRVPPDAAGPPPRTPPRQTFGECPCRLHVASSAPLLCGGGSSGQHDNYGSALAAQPGRSQGRPATNASSRLNPLERLNKEVKRHADVVGIFPNEAAIIRLIGAVLLEQNDEWQLQHRSMQVEAMAELSAAPGAADPRQIPCAA
jgi:hypothetical protein